MGPEEILDGCRVKLIDGIDAAIAVEDAKHSDGIVCQRPDDGAIYISTRAEPEYPCFMVLPDTSELVTDLGTEVLSDTMVRIVVWVAEGDEETLTRTLLRTLEAVKHCILQDRNLGSAGYGLYWRKDDYGPVFRPVPQGHFVQSVSAVFKVKKNTPV